MANVRLSVTNSLHVAAAEPASYTKAGFDALTYTEVGEVTDLGEFGGTSQMPQHVPLNTGVVAKRKGSIDYGTLALQLGQLIGDAGQDALKDGFDGANKYAIHSFMIENSKGERAYFTGMIASFTRLFNDANAVTGINSSIELDAPVLIGEDAASLLAWGAWRFNEGDVTLVEA